MADKEKDKERNYVAEAQNWEARVRGELDSARVSEACLLLVALSLASHPIDCT